MKRIRRAVAALDRRQQRHRPVAFVVGVVKKFGNDSGGSLAALLAYYSFLAIFPLLLVLTTILGFTNNAGVESGIVGSTLKEFPVFGDQLGKNAAHPLAGSVLALIVGIAGLLYGALGVTAAGQRAMADVWNIPAAERPGFVPRTVRGLFTFVVVGLSVAGSAAVTSVATMAGRGDVTRVLVLVGGLAINVGSWFLTFRLLTPKRVASHDLWPGAVLGGVAYTVLLSVGTALIQHQLKHAQAVYGQFAFVLGLLSWLYLVSEISLYAAEVNVVRARRLWPRSLLATPDVVGDGRSNVE